ncbi:hypothetical protein T08_8171 [Trichinella sp. T8]|nr:hypothetical protein T08_8171 [Trichinella sp. T8]
MEMEKLCALRLANRHRRISSAMQIELRTTKHQHAHPPPTVQLFQIRKKHDQPTNESDQNQHRHEQCQILRPSQGDVFEAARPQPTRLFNVGDGDVDAKSVGAQVRRLEPPAVRRNQSPDSEQQLPFDLGHGPVQRRFVRRGQQPTQRRLVGFSGPPVSDCTRTATVQHHKHVLVELTLAARSEHTVEDEPQLGRVDCFQPAVVQRHGGVELHFVHHTVAVEVHFARFDQRGSGVALVSPVETLVAAPEQQVTVGRVRRPAREQDEKFAAERHRRPLPCKRRRPSAPVSILEHDHQRKQDGER